MVTEYVRLILILRLFNRSGREGESYISSIIIAAIQPAKRCYHGWVDG